MVFYNRSNEAAALLKPGDFDWDHIFGKLGVRWLHTGGIFAALIPGAVTHLVSYLGAIVAGTIVTTGALFFLKRPLLEVTQPVVAGAS